MRLDVVPGTFARCGSCQQLWETWDDFLDDGALRLLGFQGTLTHPDANLLIFTHRCGTTVSVLTRRLRHLIPTPAPGSLTSLRGTPECPGHCLSIADITGCDRPCVNARDRELIRIVRSRMAV